MTIDFNINPYYDDFDLSDEYYRILFNPSRAVQARELTQIQSMLQQQVTNMGRHFFEEGSMVIPGQTNVNTNYAFVKLQDQYASVDIVVGNLQDRLIAGTSSGAVAKVVNTAVIDGAEPNTIWVEYQTGTSTLTFTGDTTSGANTIDNLSISSDTKIIPGMIISGTGIPAGTYITVVTPDTTNGIITMSANATATASTVSITVTTAEVFADNETIVTIDVGTTVNANTATTSATGLGSASHINTGIYFVDGIFAIVNEQTIVLDKYTNTPSYRIGLTVTKTFVDSLDDTSLNDPASGSTNFNAPGADRWKVELVLSKLTLASIVEENFIEVARVNNGIIEFRLDRTANAELERTLARRTHDINGDFTTKFFPIDIREHLDDGTNRGIYSGTAGGDTTKLAVGLEPGKAYVKGFERESIATTFVNVDKGRDTADANNYPTVSPLGNYVDVDTIEGTFDLTAYDDVNLHIATKAVPGIVVGTAKIRHIEWRSGTPGASAAVYRIWLFDIQMNSDTAGPYPFSTNVKSIISQAGDGQADVVLVGGEAVLSETNQNIAIWKAPQDVIATFDLGSGVDTTYKVRRKFTGTTSSDVITITAGTDEVFDAYEDSDWHLSLDSSGVVYDLDGAGNSVVLGGAPTGKQATITVGGIGNANVTIIATLTKTIANEKTKTLTNTSQAISATSIMQLTKSDVYVINSVVSNDTAATDYTDRFELDTGQRDNFYDRGRVLLKTGKVLPAGSLLVDYDYFAHGTGDYFSVDSYDGVIDYADIQLFTSPTTGKTFELRDCFDFRPRMNDAGTGFSGTGGVTSEFPIPNDSITADFQYYLPRIDKVYVSSLGEFKVKQGVSNLNPAEPQDPDDGMTLYTLNIPAYTFVTTDVETNLIDNRNYTMKDIGRIEKRIENVEYYTALSLLEKEIASQFIDDGTGADRFKNGFLVDNFTGHNIGDINNADYAIAIDPAEGIARPQFVQKNIDLDYNSGSSSNITKTGDLITLPFTETSILEQPYASSTEKLNGNGILSWVGSVELDPPSDDWKATNIRPDIIFNDGGTFDQYKTVSTDNMFGTQWDEWRRSWTGIPTSGSSIKSTADTAKNGTSFLTATLVGETRRGVRTTVVPNVVRQVVGNRILDIVIVPYIRTQTISFDVTRLKPNTKVYAFFDDVNVSTYITPTGGSLGGDIITDKFGNVSGTFAIPATDTLKFRTGERLFRLSDSASDTNPLTSAQIHFSAKGALQTVLNGITSIRESKVETIKVDEDETKTVGISPLSQSFIINNSGGAFVSKIDLFFNAKDDGNAPITLQIRNMENAKPGQKVLPFSQVTLNPDSVNTGEDTAGKIATTFTFDSPVYLQEDTEYAITLITNSSLYSIWKARTGDKEDGTDRKISRNPLAGVMFRATNASTLEPVEDEDIKFNLYRCVFNTGVTGTVQLDNETIDTIALATDPYLTTSASAVITVSHTNHGLKTGATVTHSGAVATNGIPAVELNTSHVISNATLDEYDITVSTNATSTAFGGGSDILSTQNAQMDVMHIISQEIVLPNTNLAWALKTTSDTYTLATSFVSTEANNNVIFEDEKIIASGDNETASMSSAKSFQLKGTMTSTIDNISPAIDTKRMSIITIGNRINNDITDEDLSSGGDSVARYITRKVTLETPAIDLRVQFEASRPSEASFNVYYKLIREEDTTLFDDVAWTEIAETSNTAVSLNANDFKTYTFETATLPNFDTFAIKIVMTSSNRARVSEVKDFRILALGT